MHIPGAERLFPVTKTSPIDRARSLGASTPPLGWTGAASQRMAVDALRKGGLYLVPKPSHRPAPPSPMAQCLRLVRDHPFLIDAGFVAATLSVATLLWLRGW